MQDIIFDHTLHKTHFVNFHLHEGCEIYYLVSGKVKYFVEKQMYDVTTGDVFITNQTEIHKPNIEPDELYEKISIQFMPSIFHDISTEEYDLLGCFYKRKNGTNNKITLSKSQHEKMLQIFKEMDSMQSKKPAYYKIKVKNLLTDLLIILNEASSKNSDYNPFSHVSGTLYEVINYIDKNLAEDLSLSVLGEKFFVSEAHLCRTFKKLTNSTLHQYIIKKRIARARELLTSDMSVTEVMSLCGFCDFSNFIKTFKETTGTTPGKYKKRPKK